MDPAILGGVLASSVLIAAERRKQTAAQAIDSIQKSLGEGPVVLSAGTAAEFGHGIERATTQEIHVRWNVAMRSAPATPAISIAFQGCG